MGSHSVPHHVSRCNVSIANPISITALHLSALRASGGAKHSARSLKCGKLALGVWQQLSSPVTVSLPRSSHPSCFPPSLLICSPSFAQPLHVSHRPLSVLPSCPLPFSFPSRHQLVAFSQARQVLITPSALVLLLFFLKVLFFLLNFPFLPFFLPQTRTFMSSLSHFDGCYWKGHLLLFH